MKISYNKDKFEIYGKDMGSKSFKKFKKFLWTLRLFKKVEKVELDKKAKGFTIICRSEEDFNHMYDSIVCAFEDAKNKGLMPSLKIDKLEKDKTVLNTREKEYIKTGFFKFGNKLGGSKK